MNEEESKEEQTPDVLMQEDHDSTQEMPDATPTNGSIKEETLSMEEARPTKQQAKDRSLKEFLGMMDEYAPIIPDAVTDYYLSLAGFECEDKRVKRLLALAAQKFVADIAQDAYQYSKIRSSGSGAAGLSGAPAAPRGRYGKDRGRAVLTMDDLVHEYGINLKRQDFMR